MAWHQRLHTHQSQARISYFISHETTECDYLSLYWLEINHASTAGHVYMSIEYKTYTSPQKAAQMTDLMRETY